MEKQLTGHAGGTQRWN